VWAYQRSSWLEARDPFREDFEDLDRELEHLGYEAYPAMELGGPAGPSLEGYEAARPVAVRAEEGPLQTEVLAVVNTSTRWHPVFVADLPSLVALMAELGRVLADERDAPDFEERARRGREGRE
jgi:hypothetical protein